MCLDCIALTTVITVLIIITFVKFLLSRLLAVENVIDGVGNHRAIGAISMNAYGSEKENSADSPQLHN